jgi:prephenate dehydrogenase
LKIAVLGSSGAMGSFFVAYFLAAGHSVVGADKVRKRGQHRSGFTFAKSNRDAVSRADVVLIAVPISKTTKVVREIASSLQQGALVLEISSVKGRTTRQLNRTLSGRGVKLLSLHPLFGPTFASDNFKLCVVGRKADLPFAKGLFPNAQLLLLGPGEHDRLMAYVLSLVHLTNIALVSTISKETGVKKFRKAATPTSGAQISIAMAVLSQDPSLYSYIQTENPFALDALDAMISELTALRKIVGERQRKKFESVFSSLASEFKGAELEESLKMAYAHSMQ